MFVNEIFVGGLILGGVYALLSIGFALITGVARVFNLAHGSLYMLCAYYIYLLFPILGLGVSIVLALILTVITGILIYQLFIHPLRKKNFPAMAVTLSLAMFFQSLITIIWGSNPKAIPRLIQDTTTVFDVTVSNQELLLLMVTTILVVLLALFINRTRVGRSIKAVAQNMDVARLVGINVRNTFMISMGISALLAGFAAVLYVPLYSGVSPTIWTILFKVFPVLVLGGLGSLKGALVGAFIIAFTEQFLAYNTSGGDLAQVVPFAVMLIIIFIRPTGIFGKEIYK